MDIVLSAHNVDFRSVISYPEINVERGKATFIRGESGCGKSTLFKLFNAALSPDGGEIFYNGKNIDEYNSVLLRREIILVSQSVYLFDKTIEENFSKYYEYRGIAPLGKEKMKEFLDICCADFSFDSDCKTMSGGERQRIFTAICMSFMPKVLMLDEPTSALDEKTSEAMMKNIKDFCNKNDITLLCISHDPKLAEKFADNVITLNKEELSCRAQ